MLLAGYLAANWTPRRGKDIVSAISAVHKAPHPGDEVNCHSACGGTHKQTLLYT